MGGTRMGRERQCCAAGCYCRDYTRLQWITLSILLVTLTLVYYLWLLYYVNLLCVQAGIMQPDLQGPGNFVNITLTENVMCGSFRYRLPGFPTIIALVPIMAHLVTTIEYHGIPFELFHLLIIWFLSLFVCYLFIGFKTFNAYLWGFGVVFLVYVCGTAASARPHFRRNLVGLHDKVTNIGRIFLVAPSVFQLLVLFYALTQVDRLWNAHLYAGADLADPNATYCSLSNYGPVQRHTLATFAYCAGDVPTTTNVSSVAACGQLAFARQVEFYAWEVANQTCQLFNSCPSWGSTGDQDQESGQSWVGFGRCSMMLRKYWDTVSMGIVAEGALQWASCVGVMMVAFAMRRVYFLDPYLSLRVDDNAKTGTRRILRVFSIVDRVAVPGAIAGLVGLAWETVYQVSSPMGDVVGPGTDRRATNIYSAPYSGLSQHTPALGAMSLVMLGACCFFMGFGMPFIVCLKQHALKKNLLRQLSHHNRPASVSHLSSGDRTASSQGGVALANIVALSNSSAGNSNDDATPVVVPDFLCVKDQPRVQEIVQAMSLFDGSFRRGHFSGLKLASRVRLGMYVMSCHVMPCA